MSGVNVSSDILIERVQCKNFDAQVNTRYFCEYESKKWISDECNPYDNMYL